jgi:hypothetical protein
MTRHEVIEQAIKQCLEELYTRVQPAITWEKFKNECRKYSDSYKEWEALRSKGDKRSLQEYCGPKPYEFYYLPSDVMKEICDSYVSAYKLDAHKNLLDIIGILKDYCENPIVDKYIEREGNQPGYRGYDHPDNLEKEIVKILGDVAVDNTYYQHAILNKFYKFLDMAGDFFNWNSDLNTFSINVYLGISPCSNKDAVINNWKKYRNKDITIDDSIYKEDEED